MFTYWQQFVAKGLENNNSMFDNKFMQEKMNEQKINWLSKLIQERIEKNPQFSLRAFAKKVNASPTVISRILSGKRN